MFLWPFSPKEYIRVLTTTWNSTFFFKKKKENKNKIQFDSFCFGTERFSSLWPHDLYNFKFFKTAIWNDPSIRYWKSMRRSIKYYKVIWDNGIDNVEWLIRDFLMSLPTSFLFLLEASGELKTKRREKKKLSFSSLFFFFLFFLDTNKKSIQFRFLFVLFFNDENTKNKDI